MTYKLHSVRISQIDQQDLAYRISTPKPIGGLIESIRQIGIINPPILMPVDNSGYRIVTGFHRIAACSKLGWPNIQAHILLPDIKPVRILGLAIADNAQHRGLNLIEQATAVEKLQHYFSSEAEMTAFASSLGFPLSRELVPRLRCLNRLADSIKERVASNVIPLTIALELERLGPSEAEAAANFFDELRPTLNQQKELLLLVKEIAKAEDESLSDVLKRPPVSDIRLDNDLERPQKLKIIRSYLKKRRFPMIQKFEDAFYENLRALDLPKEMVLSAPAGFEGNRFSIMFSFRTQDEFKAHLGNLLRLAEDSHFLAIVNKQFEDQEALY